LVVPEQVRWQDLKDLFRKESKLLSSEHKSVWFVGMPNPLTTITLLMFIVGEVAYVELFTDESEKPRGCGIIEFENNVLAKKAIEKMHRHELSGRKIVVKEVTNSIFSRLDDFTSSFL